jgi:hypothetical protein
VTRLAAGYAVVAVACVVVIGSACWIAAFGWPLPFAALYGVLP